MQRALRRYEDALDAGFLTWEEDIAFHLAIAAASGNAIYPRVLEALSDLLTEVRRRTATVPRAAETARHEHRQIVAAIRAADTEAARHAMCTHIHSARGAMRSALIDPTNGADMDTKA